MARLGVVGEDGLLKGHEDLLKVLELEGQEGKLDAPGDDRAEELRSEFSKTLTAMGNKYWDTRMNAVSVTSIQQIADLAFYRRGNQWTDSRLVNDAQKLEASRTIEFGSPEFLELAHRLAKEGRQGSIALRGDILLSVDGKSVLVKGPAGK